uniref:Uncharacterized protein n=1 Tax=Chenopodium quinoa TaxID=63459 RepID=A0A803LJV6_CHEQI
MHKKKETPIVPGPRADGQTHLCSMVVQKQYAHTIDGHVEPSASTAAPPLRNAPAASVDSLAAPASVEGGVILVEGVDGILEELTAIKASGRSFYKTMISDSDYTEFENFTKWLGVSQ